MNKLNILLNRQRIINYITDKRSRCFTEFFNLSVITSTRKYSVDIDKRIYRSLDPVDAVKVDVGEIFNDDELSAIFDATAELAGAKILAYPESLQLERYFLLWIDDLIMTVEVKENLGEDELADGLRKLRKAGPTLKNVSVSHDTLKEILIQLYEDTREGQCDTCIEVCAEGIFTGVGILNYSDKVLEELMGGRDSRKNVKYMDSIVTFVENTLNVKVEHTTSVLFGCPLHTDLVVWIGTCMKIGDFIVIISQPRCQIRDGEQPL